MAFDKLRLSGCGSKLMMLSANDPFADVWFLYYTALMEKLEAKFRAGLASAFALVTVAASIGFYLLPASPYGRMSRVLRTEDGFTIFGLIVFAIFCVFSLIALFSATRSWIGLPAISYDERVLTEYVVPFRRIPISDVERIEVRANEAYLHMKSGSKLTVNVRLVKDHESFFSRIILN